jgi:P-type conjugative transfer protein TrbJ
MERRMSYILIFLFLFGFTPKAMAVDVATEHTQIMNNIQLLISAAHQVESLYNEAQMIQHQIEQLKSIATYRDSWSNADDIRSQLYTLVNQGVSVSDQTQDLLTRMQQEASALLNNGSLSDQQRSIGRASMNVITLTLGRIRQNRQSYQSQESALRDLLQKNNAAVGQTQALQVLNQISAHNITQMQATQECLHDLASQQMFRWKAEDQEKQNMDDRIDAIVHPIEKGNSSFSFGS